MKTRTSKKFTKKRTSKKKSIIPYIVGGVAILGAGYGVGMLYKHYTKERVLVIDSFDNNGVKYYEQDIEYQKYIGDKRVISNVTYNDIFPDSSLFDKVIVIVYSGIDRSGEYAGTVGNVYDKFENVVLYDYSTKKIVFL